MIDRILTVKVVIATATAAANRQNISDISIIILEGLADTLLSLAEAAAGTYGGILERRQDSDMSKRVTEASKTVIPRVQVILEILG